MNMSTSYSFSVWCIMKDHILALYAFSCSPMKKKGYFQILLFQLGVPFQSYWICGLRHEADIQQQEVQNSTETVKAKLCCVVGEPIMSKSDLWRKLWQFCELHHTLCICQTWALLSLKQNKQNTGQNLVQWPVKLNVRRCARSNLGSVWVFKLNSKTHCNFSVVFGLTEIVLQHQSNFLHFQ